MDKSAFLQLADHCEAATGADRELERAIKAALEDRIYVSFQDDLANRRGATPPAFTASLDAAVGLMPDGWKPLIDGRGERAAVTLYPPEYDPSDWKLMDTADGRAATLALAFTAACLRARAA